jgi:hypothetical protein
MYVPTLAFADAAAKADVGLIASDTIAARHEDRSALAAHPCQRRPCARKGCEANAEKSAAMAIHELF